MNAEKRDNQKQKTLTQEQAEAIANEMATELADNIYGQIIDGFDEGDGSYDPASVGAVAEMIFARAYAESATGTDQPEKQEHFLELVIENLKAKCRDRLKLENELMRMREAALGKS